MITNDTDRHYDCCPICSSSIKIWATKKTDYGKYRIDRCRSCDYAFVNPRPSNRFLRQYYSDFGHGSGSSRTNVTLDVILKREEEYPNSSIDAHRIIKTIGSLKNKNLPNTFLDIGCGYGFFSKEAIAAGYDVTALELASTERYVTEKIAAISPVPLTFEDYEHSDSCFSVILMSQILEHANDIHLWISKAYDLLVDDGVLVVAVPNFNSLFRYAMQKNDPYVSPPAHLNYFTSDNLCSLLSRSGFEVQKIQWISRIPRDSFAKRFSTFGNPTVSVIHSLSGKFLWLIDKLHVGMMLNIYAVKKPVIKKSR